MFYSLPPAPPAILYVETAPDQVTIANASDCKRGSRDCFPTDRVGHQPSEPVMIAVVPFARPLADGGSARF